MRTQTKSLGTSRAELLACARLRYEDVGGIIGPAAKEKILQFKTKKISDFDLRGALCTGSATESCMGGIVSTSALLTVDAMDRDGELALKVMIEIPVAESEPLIFLDFAVDRD